jgi:hypothetical protein
MLCCSFSASESQNKTVAFPTPENLINYKRLVAKAGWIKLQKQKSSCEEFVNSMSAATTTKTTWSKIQCIKGK